MSDTYLGQNTDMVLGQEFLTWLWFRSETGPASFSDGDGRPFSVVMERRVVVQRGEGDALETAAVSGSLSQLREARLGLRTGKKVTRSLIRLEQESLSWQISLKAEDFAMGSLRTPKVEQEDDDDPDAVFLEKMYLVDRCLQLFDTCFRLFLSVRLSPEWDEEAHAVGVWMSRDEGRLA